MCGNLQFTQYSSAHCCMNIKYSKLKNPCKSCLASSFRIVPGKRLKNDHIFNGPAPTNKKTRP